MRHKVDGRLFGRTANQRKALLRGLVTALFDNQRIETTVAKAKETKRIAELVQKTEPEMLKTKNFGRKSLNEIKEILSRMGLHLGMKIDLDNLDKEEALQTGGMSNNAS